MPKVEPKNVQNGKQPLRENALISDYRVIITSNAANRR